MLLSITLFFTLTHGITLHKISLPGLEINEFYIKLDKKLIITINKIKIEKSKKSSGAIQEIDKIAQWLQYLPHYFHQVQIDDLAVGKQHLHLLYLNDIFYVDTDMLQLASKITYLPAEKRIAANVHKLYIKAPKLSLAGNFIYDIPEKRWKGDGKYHAFDIDGRFSLSHINNVIRFELDSKPAASIKALIDYIAPPEPIKVWIYPKIPAKRYILHYLKGEITLEKDGSVAFDPKRLKASATAYDAKIYFHADVPPVSTRQIDITLKNDVLAFKLYDPLYEGKKLNGSYVKIRDLTNRHAELDAHIVVKDRIDTSIKTILSAYGIQLPFVQTEGKTDAVVDLTVQLVTGKVTRYRGVYKAKYAKLLFDNVIPLPVENLHVISRDSTITINPCHVTLDPYLDATLSGTIDLREKNGTFTPLIHRLQYRYATLPLLKMKNRRVPVTMHFDKKITFALPDLELSISYIPGGSVKITASDLKHLKPYFQGPLVSIEDGSFEAAFSSKTFETNGTLEYANDILSSKGRPIEKFVFEAHRSPGQMTLRINRNIFITAQQQRTFLNIKAVDIHIAKLLEKIEPYLSDDSNVSQKGESHMLHIEGHESTLFYKSLKLPCKFYNAQIKRGPFSIKFVSKHETGEIRGIIENGHIDIGGKHLPDYVMRGLTTLEHLYGGYFDFNAIGKIDDFNGTILMQDTLWAKSAVYNNMLAMLNTIPAVLTLKNPGFSKKGFKIKRGALQYHFKSPILFFDNILLQGDSAQITGRGKVDFESDTIAMKMQIHFLESLTNVLSKIPVAGYLIFGNDGTIAITLNIDGPLQNPKVRTETAKDIMKAPLNILERTLTLPFKLFR
ncbi:YhdP family protein [Hydrogenimonas cancrithermarum]|uniref:YhdP central domain-containing protein n=1 Tax=Hydrogenimonas cancrithermarum TaxID=2993563 RepID=A0ABN6WTH6_9BACT|nr:AsmA-like C-terminal domain-containing protein [Hydrogenimonas cancrithermarum]BDY12173.1 hypothetical protein HCR_04850 [Hydrogenimonas cancrithermarum]